MQINYVAYAHDTEKWADEQIKRIQSGEIDRHDFPESMKGEIAKDQWHDAKFAYGMEYGYLLAMLELKKHLYEYV